MNKPIKYEVSIPAPNGVGSQVVSFFTLVGARILAKAYGVMHVRDLENNCYLPASTPCPRFIAEVLSLDPYDCYSLTPLVKDAFNWIRKRSSELVGKRRSTVIRNQAVLQAKTEWLEKQLDKKLSSTV